MTVCKTYIVSVDFNFDGQKNKYLELAKAQGYREGQQIDAHKPYDFKCSFPGVEPGDKLVVMCATGYQVVEAKKVTQVDGEIPEHATARIIAKLDLDGIAKHEDMAAEHERIERDIADRIREADREKKLKKLAKKDPHLAVLVSHQRLLEGKHTVTYVRERESE